jgi:hypothetical protein
MIETLTKQFIMLERTTFGKNNKKYKHAFTYNVCIYYLFKQNHLPTDHLFTPRNFQKQIQMFIN